MFWLFFFDKLVFLQLLEDVDLFIIVLLLELVLVVAVVSGGCVFGLSGDQLC